MMRLSERQKEKLKDIRKTEDGRYEYTGKLFRISGNGKNTRVRMTLFLLLLSASVIGSGCIDAAVATRSFYVILPYIGEVSALFALVWNFCKIVPEREGVREYVLSSVRSAIPASCRVLTLFAVFGFIASVIYFAVNGMAGSAVKNMAYPFLKLFSAILAEFYRRSYQGIAWEETDKHVS